jgi:hydroxyacylglutathione hydrolase
LIVKSMAVGPIMANCFIVGCEATRQAAVIDPGDEGGRILTAAAEDQLTIKYIINTHGHFDHVSANQEVQAATDAPILIHEKDAGMLNQISATAAGWGLSAENSPPPGQLVDEGDVISFGNIKLTVIHTPGHTVGGISLATDGYVFVGDTLFAGSIGRTDFPGGDHGTIIASIQKKLFVLDDSVRVMCGHGPETTIGTEKRTNPFARLA